MKLKYTLFIVLLIMSFIVHSQTIKLIPNPDTISNGFSNWSKAFNNYLYAPYKNSKGKYQLVKFDGKKFTMYNNPDTGSISYILGSVQYKNSIVFLYENKFKQYQLAKFDGSNVILLNNPDTGLGIALYSSHNDSTIILFNNELYFVYIDINNVNRLAKFDGSNITLISNPDASKVGINDNKLVVFKNNLFFGYTDNLNNYRLAKFDGSKISINNIGNLTSKISDLVEYKNNLILVSKWSLIKYDTINFTNVSYPDTSYFYDLDNILVSNGNLYFTLENQKGIFNTVKYDGNSFIKIANPDLGGSVNTTYQKFNNEVYSKYSKINGKFILRKFDGYDTTFFNNPDSGLGVEGCGVINNKLFVAYQNLAGKLQYGKVNGRNITLFSNPDAGQPVYSICSINNVIYVGYQNAKGKAQLAILDSSVSYIVNGNMLTRNNDYINDVKVKYKGEIQGDYICDNLGSFYINLEIGNYTIIPSKNNDINKTNGVTSLDLALTQSHILGKNKLNNPYKIIAADVNGDGKITTLDLVYMKRLILGIDTTFTNSTTKENRLWAFVDSSYQFPDTTNPFPFKDSISYIGLSANKSNQSFIGVKLGDVNWDWNPLLAKTPSKVFVKPKKISINE